ncbi:SOS response-associated peptidase family protein [Paenibacillus cremeus]
MNDKGQKYQKKRFLNTLSYRQYKWGLVHFWAKSQKLAYSMINGWAETVTSKPAFREPFKRSRIILVSDGFFYRSASRINKSSLCGCC